MAKTYTEWKTAQDAAEANLNTINATLKSQIDEAQREYVVGNITIRVSPGRFEVFSNKNPGVFIPIAARELTAAQFKACAEIRNVEDDWETGKRPSMPPNGPWAAPSK